MIAGVSQSRAVSAGVRVPARSRSGTVALLPTPERAAIVNVQDALSLLYALRMRQGNAEAKCVEIAMTHQKKESAQQLRRELAAIDCARQAEEEASGFWAKLESVAGTVAKVSAIVAGAALTVFTGGTGAVLVVALVAVALSVSGIAVRETKVLGEDSDKVGFGLEIAGAVVGLVASAGTSAGSLGSSAASASGTAAQTAKTSAQLTTAAATGTQAVAKVRIADLHAEAEHARADATDARFRMTEQTHQTEFVLRTLAASKEAEQEALDTTIEAIEGCNRAADVAIAGVRG